MLMTNMTSRNALNYIDFVFRGYSVFIHLAYFTYIALRTNTEMRSRTYLFLHNVCLVSFLLSLLYATFINSRSPSFASAQLNKILCTICELIWTWLKYARILSLLLLAFYRYMACLHITLYKRLNSKLTNIYSALWA